MRLPFSRRAEQRSITSVPWFGQAAHTDSGVEVNDRTALQLSAVWACVTFIADLIAQMPVEVYRTLPDGTSVLVPNASPVLTQPTLKGLSLRDWLGQVMISLLLRGNAYGLVMARGANNYPTAIEWLHPDWVTVAEPLPLAVPQYFVLGVPTPADDLVHIRGNVMPGRVQGMSPIEYQAQSIGVGLATQKFAAQWFGQGAHPSAILSTDHKIDEDGARTIKDRFLASVRGRREPAVLGAGITYTPIQVTPEQSQFLGTQQYSVADIARIYRLPAEMIGAVPQGKGSITYANRDQRAQDLLTFTIQFWMAKVEDALSSILPMRQRAKLDPDCLLRSDLMTRYQAHAIALEGQFMTIPEVRAKEDLPPIEGGPLYPVGAEPPALPPFAPKTAK